MKKMEVNYDLSKLSNGVSIYSLKKEKTIKYVNKWQKLLITFAVFSRCLKGYRGIIILRNVGIL